MWSPDVQMTRLLPTGWHRERILPKAHLFIISEICAAARSTRTNVPEQMHPHESKERRQGIR